MPAAFLANYRKGKFSTKPYFVLKKRLFDSTWSVLVGILVPCSSFRDIHYIKGV